MKEKILVNNLSSYITADNLVHAYGIEGGVNVAQSLLKRLADVCGMEVKGNPDVHVHSFSSMGIDEARALEGAALSRAFTGGKKFFIITVGAITREAQNALLKLFEEPTEGTHFFLIIPSHSILLPTLRSRLLLLSLETEGLSDERAKEFFSATPAKRLLLIKDIVEAKDKAAAIMFLNELEVYMHKQISFKEATLSERNAFKDIERARSYLTDRAPSVKMLLEQVALSLPHRE